MGIQQKKIVRNTKPKKIVRTDARTARANKRRQDLIKSKVAPPAMIDNISHRPDFPIIVTGYTVSCHLGDYYKKAIIRLVRSCIKFDLPYMVYPLKSVTDWVTGCALKPTVILHALQTLKRPILWIDADAEIFKFPDLMQKMQDYEMALHSQSGHWLTGTLYFDPSVIDFVGEWLQCTKPPDPDEITLLHLFTNHDKPPKLLNLPVWYNNVIYEGVDLKDFVIGHYMRPDVAASRGVKAITLPDYTKTE